ncbi:MAG: bifunctional DNA-formamidopyrimidine glycosylase/DNA-(apurinic or apyrimidinic site) lyase [Alphaproteobacteria bacterium]
MPELPEVETVRQGLAPHITGKTLQKLDLHRSDLRFPFPKDIRQRLEGQIIKSIDRRAKYLLLRLDSADTAIIHLGMSGRLQIEATSRTPLKHDHVVFHFQDGPSVYFNDARRFGMFTITNDPDQHPYFVHLGPEPLQPEFTPAVLQEKLSRKKSSIKTAILDQRVVVGVGNIYASEALYRSKIHPEAACNTLKKSDFEALVKHIKDVLSEAIAAGGSTLRDHQQPDGELGYFQHTFRVYDQEGSPCPSCSIPITRITQSGRSSFFCPNCQAR